MKTVLFVTLQTIL